MSAKVGTLVLVVCWILSPILSPAQQGFSPDAVPPKFDADLVFAAHIRALTLSSAQPATGRYATGRQVLNRLTQQLPPSRMKFNWDLRIAKDAGNVFASPDGTIFVDEELADLLGSHAGLWAAALSHEVAHVVRRDWARRYLYQKFLQEAAGNQIVGGTDAATDSWVAPESSSRLFDDFCQRMELDADAEGLRLMARAGYYPDYMLALYHILQAQPAQLNPKLLDSSHPLWNDRDEKLRSDFLAASLEFDRLWPDRCASPGGGPPVVVNAGVPFARCLPVGFEVVVPLHCDNLYGSVEVVLRLGVVGSPLRELRQYTGCTSNHTEVTFTLANSDLPGTRTGLQVAISVLDDRGGLLARALIPKPIR